MRQDLFDLFISIMPCIRQNPGMSTSFIAFSIPGGNIVVQGVAQPSELLLELSVGFRCDCDILTCVAFVDASLSALNQEILE